MQAIQQGALYLFAVGALLFFLTLLPLTRLLPRQLRRGLRTAALVSLGLGVLGFFTPPLLSALLIPA